MRNLRLSPRQDAPKKPGISWRSNQGMVELACNASTGVLQRTCTPGHLQDPPLTQVCAVMQQGLEADEWEIFRNNMGDPGELGSKAASCPACD